MTWHPLVKSDRQGATADSNQNSMEVIRRLPEGTDRTAEINMMIEANIPLVLAKVNTYIGLHSSVEFLFDDLTSEGLVALTIAVNKLAGMGTPDDGGNCTGFIGNRIVWAICKLVDHDEKQQIPKDYVPPGPTVVDPMDIVDSKDLIYSACQSPEDRVILKMREKGNTDQEIAERLDISRRAVNFMRHELLQRYNDLEQRLES